MSGRSTLCLLDQEARYSAVGEICSPIAKALDEGMLTSFLWEEKDGGVERVVVGLVPDGVRKVVLETRGFPEVVATVDGNVYALKDGTPEPPEQARLIPAPGSG